MSVGPSWALAFLTSVLLTAAVIPLLRKVALAVDFVDRPGDHKSHVRPTPYLGGVGLIAGVLAGMLLASQLGPHGLVVALGATVLGTVGLIDDHRTVSPSIRLVLEVGVAALALSVGLRISATGVPLFDVLLTLVWIVGITNALNLLDNMDGLAGGVAAAAATAIFVLALLGGQELTASVAAALLGACLGFLVYNRRPASIFMGDTGSLFLGFALAVLSIEVDPALSPPASFAVPLLLLSLPVLDTVTVALARLRRAKAVSVGGRDHLSHRLVARGLSRGPAVVVLVGVEAILGALAVAAGRRVVPLWLALAGATAVLGGLSLATSRVAVYVEPVVGWPRWMKRVVVTAAGAVLLVAGPAVLALARAQAPARAGERLARQGLITVMEGRSSEAAAEFRRAEILLHRARGHLESPLTSLGLAVPGVSGNLQASRTLVATGERLASAGGRLVTIGDANQLAVREGTLPLDELRRLAPALADAARLLRDARDRLAEVRHPYLVPAIQRPLNDLSERLVKDAESVELAADAARALPSIFGADGPRHYFVAFQNNAELRGSGGLIGNWAELTAEDGRLQLTRFDRLEALIRAGSGGRVLHAPQEFVDRYRDFDVAGSWQQVNVSPDFPTTARVIADLYPQSGGRPVDGVMAVDPAGLGAFLELTGPVPVPGWPEPLTAENVGDVSLRAAYERYPVQAERVQFLGELSRTVFETLTRTELASPSAILGSLGKAARGNHLFMYLNRPDEQGLVTRLGADGAVPPVRGDSLLVVNQNLSANKVDLYLHRRVRYSVTLDPSSDLAAVSGTLEVTLDNRAPPDGLPQGVIGPYDERFAPGENRTYVSLATPFAGRSATIDGRPLPLELHPELGRLSSSATVSIPPLESRTIRMELQGRVQLAEGGWYRLDLGHQPLVVPDDVDITISVPRGWRIAETRGLTRRDARQAETRLRLDGERSLLVRVERAGWSAFWHRLAG